MAEEISFKYNEKEFTCKYLVHTLEEICKDNCLCSFGLV